MSMRSRKMLFRNRLSSLWIASLVLVLPDHRSAGRSDQAFASPSHSQILEATGRGNVVVKMLMRERGCLRIRGGYLSRTGITELTPPGVGSLGIAVRGQATPTSPSLLAGVVPGRHEEITVPPPLSLDPQGGDSPTRRTRRLFGSFAAQTPTETGTGEHNAKGAASNIEAIEGPGGVRAKAFIRRQSGKRCKHMGCPKRAHYGNDDDANVAVFCAGHKLVVRPSPCGRAAPSGFISQNVLIKWF